MAHQYTNMFCTRLLSALETHPLPSSDLLRDGRQDEGVRRRQPCVSPFPSRSMAIELFSEPREQFSLILFAMLLGFVQ